MKGDLHSQEENPAIVRLRALDGDEQGVLLDELASRHPHWPRIAEKRFLQDPPASFRELGKELGISRWYVSILQGQVLRHLSSVLQTDPLNCRADELVKRGIEDLPISHRSRRKIIDACGPTIRDFLTAAPEIFEKLPATTRAEIAPIRQLLLSLPTIRETAY
jgi:hypothetical protein